MSANWIDSDPSRYRGIRSGDYGPFQIYDQIHFVKLHITSYEDGYEIQPEERAACGLPTPNWRDDPKSYPINGIVDCSGCIAEMREAQARESGS